jgi:hypothetical protein
MPKHVHTFGEWTNFSDDTETACEKKLSFATCSVCGEIGWQQGRHTYNTYSITPPTCTENGYHSYTCVVCGETDTVPAEEPLGHEWDKCYSYDDASHWIACLDCDARDSLSKHTLDENGFCKACTVGSDSEEFAYKLSEDSTYAALVGYFGEKTEIVVPTSYKKFSVKEISGGAFARNKSITSVVIPQGITYIGAAFGECTALAKINIPEGVTELGGGVFSECTSLTSITLPRSLVKIGARAFYGCKSLESVTFLDADTWYYEWHHTDGTEISVTDPTANATYLKKTYYMYFWTKK